MDRVSKYFDRCVITRHGEPEAVIMSIEDYESILETMEIQADKSLVRRLKKADEEVRQGRGTTLEEARKELGLV
jgi:prevent-host-death family protein